MLLMRAPEPRNQGMTRAPGPGLGPLMLMMFARFGGRRCLPIAKNTTMGGVGGTLQRTSASSASMAEIP